MSGRRERGQSSKPDVNKISQELFDQEIAAKHPDLLSEFENLRRGYNQGNLSKADESRLEYLANQIVQLKQSGGISSDKGRQRRAKGILKSIFH